MCTVTYIPTVDKYNFVLTSNRDEKSVRPTLLPEIAEYHGIKLCFPMDVESGGSWIAMNNRGRIVCLLNGGFVAHLKKEFHTHSRGKVLFDLAVSELHASSFFESQHLENTEPFTILTIDQKDGIVLSFSEMIWDGTHKHYRELDTETPQIWSSVTLYDDKERKLRTEWFRQFLETHNTEITKNDIFNFHSKAHTHNQEIDLVMQRNNGIKTVSITQITSNGKLEMTYNDLQNKKTSFNQL